MGVPADFARDRASARSAAPPTPAPRTSIRPGVPLQTRFKRIEGPAPLPAWGQRQAKTERPRLGQGAVRAAHALEDAHRPRAMLGPHRSVPDRRASRATSSARCTGSGSSGRGCPASHHTMLATRSSCSCPSPVALGAGRETEALPRPGHRAGCRGAGGSVLSGSTTAAVRPPRSPRSCAEGAHDQAGAGRRGRSQSVSASHRGAWRLAKRLRPGPLPRGSDVGVGLRSVPRKVVGRTMLADQACSCDHRFERAGRSRSQSICSTSRAAVLSLLE